jgi:hypothetical protein
MITHEIQPGAAFYEPYWSQAGKTGSGNILYLRTDHPKKMIIF